MTSTELAHSTPAGGLSLSPGQTDWTPEQLAVVKQIGLENASHEELQVFLHICQRSGLDPFARQIYGIMRNQYNPNTRRSEPKLTIQTGIDGFRLIASRPDRATGKPSGFEGRIGPMWCGEDGVWSDVWLQPGRPYAAKCGVLKAGYREPIWAVCLYREFVQTKSDGTPNQFWGSMPANQLGKVAEAAALRAAFPQDLSGIYVPEEMGRVAAMETAARTVDANPMRTPEEQALWDRMEDAEQALDADELKAIYSVAAKGKLDLLVAAITAAGYRVRGKLAAQAAAAEAEPVEADVVEPTPAVAEPEAESIPDPTGEVPSPPMSTEQKKLLKNLFDENKFPPNDKVAWLKFAWIALEDDSLKSIDKLTSAQAEVVAQALRDLPAEQEPPASEPAQ